VNIHNEFKMTLDAKSVNESFCRMVVSAFAAQLDPTIEELNDLKTAVSEAVTNAVVHGYQHQCGKLVLEGQILDKGIVRIKIRDKGVGIDDVAKAMQPLFTTGGEERSGLGFTVMQSFCDRVKVTSSKGKGTTVLLTKRIAGRTGW